MSGQVIYLNVQDEQGESDLALLTFSLPELGHLAMLLRMKLRKDKKSAAKFEEPDAKMQGRIDRGEKLLKQVYSAMDMIRAKAQKGGTNG